MKNLILIYNPKAGKGGFLSSLAGVIDLFVKAKWNVEVYPTQAQDDAIRKVVSMEDRYDLIVTAGGDGTLDEVVTGLERSGKKVPIGYLPVGSTNDFAASLGLSSNPLEQARAIITGRPAGIDMGKFNEGVFVYVAAFGAFTDVAYDTNQDMKNIFGHLAYIMEATKRLADIKSYRMQTDVNGEVREADYAFGMITNSISVGGMRNITGKGVELDDGLFEVTLVHSPKNIFEMQEIVGCLLTGNEDTSLIDTFKTDSILLYSKEELSWTLDGEYGGKGTAFRIRNLKKHMQFVLSKKQREQLTQGEGK